MQCKYPRSHMDAAVDRFKEYLRIKSVHPDPDYASCVKFLARQAVELNMEFTVHEQDNNPIAILTLNGLDKSLGAVLLNSHMDVVPVNQRKWSVDAFAANEDSQGRIIARGSQDMKCIGMMYLEAIRLLKSQGETFQRTFHVMFVPDEETGGKKGMKVAVESEWFKNLNVVFALDEGVPSNNEAVAVFYGERAPWHVRIHSQGKTGHGSILTRGTAIENMTRFLTKVNEYREQELKKFEEAGSNWFQLGSFTTINVTMMTGGVQFNVLPETLSVGLDIRLPIHIDRNEFSNQLDQWAQGCTVEYAQRWMDASHTPLDESNLYWKHIEQVLKEMNWSHVKAIFAGATDARYLRAMCIPAIGITPVIGTPFLLHDHDEFITRDSFIKGIEFYQKLIAKINK